MRGIIALGGFISSVSLLTPLARASCYQDGAELGKQEAIAFCTSWERMYNNDTVVYPFRSFGMHLCDQQFVTACKYSMADYTRDNYPLCTQLVRSAWVNSQGKNAFNAWAQWQRGACVVVTP